MKQPSSLFNGTILLHWLLRVSVLFCFVGHGAFGIITKAEWLPFFRAVRIPDSLAWQLMPLIGAMDIFVGLFTFFRPVRFILVWAAFWCILTALMRPMAGMSWFEFLERAGNYGVPILLLMSTTTSETGWRAWFARLHPRPLDLVLIRQLSTAAIIFTSVLLLGHAGFGLKLAKLTLQQHYASIGLIAGDGFNLVRGIGLFELLLAVTVLLVRARTFFIGIALWKIGTETLYPISGAPVWETIERAGSYALPLAIVVLITCRSKASSSSELVQDKPSSIYYTETPTSA